MNRLPLSAAAASSILAMALGCSPSKPPPAQGSAYFSVASSTTCLAGIGALGNPEPPSAPGSPTMQVGDLFEDGQETAEDSGQYYAVSCRISGAGPFSLEVELEGPNSSPPASDTATVNIRLSGTVDANGAGSGTVNFYTPKSETQTSAADEPCTFTAAPDPLHICTKDGCNTQHELPVDEKKGEPLLPDWGKVFLTFNCPSMSNGSNMNGEKNACVGSGTIALQHCDKD